MSIFNKLKDKLKNIFKKDDKTVDIIEIEDMLIEADFGPSLSYEISSMLKKSDNIEEDLSNIIKSILEGHIIEDINIDESDGTTVFMFVGVNGSGKTTSIAKIAHYFKKMGKSVEIAACDTFRSAATEQLEIWANRLGCHIYKGISNSSDPASVAFDAMKNTKSDILLIDTAGRLQNNINLMNELTKISNVVKKINIKAPHKTIITIDSTIGQNSFDQVREFNKYCQIDGILLTKMDGNANGGVIVRIVKEFGIPIFGIGKGEKLEDFDVFSIEDFIKNLK